MTRANWPQWALNALLVGALRAGGQRATARSVLLATGSDAAQEHHQLAHTWHAHEIQQPGYPWRTKEPDMQKEKLAITDKQKICLMRAEGHTIAARLADAQGEVRIMTGRLSNALAIYALTAREDDLALCRSRFDDLADAIAEESRAIIADARHQLDLNIATIDQDHAMEELHVQHSNG